MTASEDNDRTTRPSVSRAAAPDLSLSGPYRAARRNLSAVSAISIAWSAVLVDFSSAEISSVGAVDFRTDSLPVLFVCAVVYLGYRLVAEFAMQQQPVRQWRLAQLDLRITLAVARLAVIFAVSSLIDRSTMTIWGFLAFSAWLSCVGIVFIGSSFVYKLFVRSYSRQLSSGNTPRKLAIARFALEAFVVVTMGVALAYASRNTWLAETVFAPGLVASKSVFSRLKLMSPSALIFAATALGSVIASLLCSPALYRRLFSPMAVTRPHARDLARIED